MGGRSRAVLATVLFTDIVGSSQLADEVGDGRWRELLSRHNHIVRRDLKRFGGHELDTAGDGFFASFARPEDAVRCADAIAADVRELGIEIRAGVHVGQAEVVGRKLGGIVVHTGARIMAAGGPGEVLVSSTAKDAVAGSSLEFADHGTHQLKGVPGEWHLFELTSLDGTQRAEPNDPAVSAERRAAILLPAPGRSRRWLVAVGALAVAAAGLIPAILLLNGGSEKPAQRSVGIAINSVFRFDPETGRVTADYPVGTQPGSIAFSGGGVWVVNFGDQTLSRIDVESGRVATIGGLEYPCLVSTDGKDGVWITPCSNGRTVIQHVDGETEQPDYSFTTAGVADQALVAHGSLWIPVEGKERYADTAQVWRIDPKTTDVKAKIDVGRTAVGLSWGAGRVWGSNLEDGTIFSIDPATNEATTSGSIATGPTSTVFAFGSLWVDDESATQIVRYDPVQRRVVAVVPNVQGSLVATHDVVWALNYQRRSITPIDPDTNQPGREISFRYASNIVAGDGGFWISAPPQGQ